MHRFRPRAVFPRLPPSRVKMAKLSNTWSSVQRTFTRFAAVPRFGPICPDMAARRPTFSRNCSRYSAIVNRPSLAGSHSHSNNYIAPRARQVGGAAAGRVDNRLHGHSRFSEILQIRQDVYPATVQKMRSARKNLPFSTGYGEMGPPCAQPFHGAPSIVPTDCRQSSRRIIVNRHNVARSTRTGDC